MCTCLYVYIYVCVRDSEKIVFLTIISASYGRLLKIKICNSAFHLYLIRYHYTVEGIPIILKNNDLWVSHSLTTSSESSRKISRSKEYKNLSKSPSSGNDRFIYFLRKMIIL